MTHGWGIILKGCVWYSTICSLLWPDVFTNIYLRLPAWTQLCSALYRCRPETWNWKLTTQQERKNKTNYNSSSRRTRNLFRARFLWNISKKRNRYSLNNQYSPSIFKLSHKSMKVLLMLRVITAAFSLKASHGTIPSLTFGATITTFGYQLRTLAFSLWVNWIDVVRKLQGMWWKTREAEAKRKPLMGVTWWLWARGRTRRRISVGIVNAHDISNMEFDANRSAIM